MYDDVDPRFGSAHDYWPTPTDRWRADRRREIVRWRESAFEAREAHVADRNQGDVLPRTVES